MPDRNALTNSQQELRCVNAHDRCYGDAGAPCPYCEPKAKTAEEIAAGLTRQQKRVLLGIGNVGSFMPLRITGQRLFDLGLISNEHLNAGWARWTPFGEAVAKVLQSNVSAQTDDAT